MLLSVETVNHPDQGSLLDLWMIGGERRVVIPPIKPYCYSKSWLPEGTVVQRRWLSRLGEGPLQTFKREFKSTRELDVNRSDDVMESHFPFKQRVAVDCGFHYESEVPLKWLAWDCEAVTANKLFPDPYKDFIRSIAVWGVDEGCRVAWTIHELPDVPKAMPSYSEAQALDAERRYVVTEFLKFVKKYDPDVLCDYNGGFYDVPLLKSECARLRIRCGLGRDGSAPYVIKKQYERRGKSFEDVKVRIAGRVHFDVWKEVAQDQYLYYSDVKRRGLNPVAKWFVLEPIEDVDHAAIPTDRLAEVNLDDARCTYLLARMYGANLISLAEYLDVPFNMIVQRSASHVGNWLMGRDLNALGIISDGTNMERFPEIFVHGSKGYQGAHVACYRTGVFFNVKHIDFKSFYPSIMIAFNLSPETVFLVKLKMHTGEYRFEDHGSYAIIEVPDCPKGSEVRRQVVCKIDLEHEGVACKRLKSIMHERFALKKEFRECKDPLRKQQLGSRQWMLKIVCNALYGNNGMRFSRYGSVLVALLTTAIGRYILRHRITADKRDGWLPIEADSDGFYKVKMK